MENKQNGSGSNLEETTQPNNSEETEALDLDFNFLQNHQLPNETEEEMVGRLFEQVEHMSRDIDGIRDELQQLHARVERLSHWIEGLRNRIPHFEVDIGDDEYASQEGHIAEVVAEVEEPMEEEVRNGPAEEAIQENHDRADFQDHGDICCICLDTHEGEEEKRELECRHVFHNHCIRRWLLRKNSCPLCNRAVFNLH